MTDRARIVSSRGTERGSAIILAMLLAFVMTLLGLSFLWFAETERRIADNERLAVQARYLANGGARVVKRWFDGGTAAPFYPPVGAADRAQRLVDRDGAGPLPAQAVGGSIPTYKAGVDRDGNGADDLFLQPFRGGDLHALLGTAAGPDVSIALPDPGAAVTNVAARDFLDQLSAAIAPDLATGGLQGRISRIEIHGPPFLPDGANWVRYGLGTVRVTAELRRGAGAFTDMQRVVARRTVELVLAEMPYQGPFGPLHSCAGVDWDTDLNVRWGPLTMMGDGNLPAATTIDDGLPRSIPGSPRSDSIWGGWPNAFSTWQDLLYGPGPGAGLAIDDPWFRVLAGGSAFGGATIQPIPSPWRNAGSWPPLDDSGLFQSLALVGCPVYEYRLWKTIAGSGYRDVRYFTWTGTGDQFREEGRGVVGSFAQLTDNRSGVYFFDTADARPPRDDDGDARFDNLTPTIAINGGTWSFRGMLFVNAQSFQIAGAAGRSTTLQPPGEPYWDSDGDGVLGAAEITAEQWLNLEYPAVVGAAFLANRDDGLRDDGTFAPGAVPNAVGAAVVADVNLAGVLFTNGRFEARGTSRNYGSVIAREGVTQNTGAAGRPEIYWDASLLDAWPPAGWDVPRVVVSRWSSSP